MVASSVFSLSVLKFWNLSRSCVNHNFLLVTRFNIKLVPKVPNLSWEGFSCFAEILIKPVVKLFWAVCSAGPKTDSFGSRSYLIHNKL